LRNRGVADVCMVACDGLKGLPEAITEIWPLASVQLCVVHLVRASLRYASKAHWSPITKALRVVYGAPTVDAAEAAFAQFEADWGQRYPAIIRLWRNAWPTFTPFLAFPPQIRRLVYTTNAIESLNARFRQATRRRGHFPNEQAALKVLYLVIRTPRPNRANVTGTTPDGSKPSTLSPCTTATGSTNSRRRSPSHPQRSGHSRSRTCGGRPG
jgi:putative transposase